MAWVLTIILVMAAVDLIGHVLLLYGMARYFDRLERIHQQILANADRLNQMWLIMEEERTNRKKEPEIEPEPVKSKRTMWDKKRK